jgi:hypothetical protein
MNDGGLKVMKVKKPFPIIFLYLCGLVITAAACNLPSRQIDMRPTYAVETVQARLTLGPVNTSIPDSPLPTGTGTLPSSTERGPETPTNTPIPPTETNAPCERAGFVSDVTVPDGTIFSAGESFTKTWRLKNLGTCTWTPDHELLFKDGDSMGGPASQQFTTGSVAPGQTVDISVNLVAPSTDGVYKGFWWIRADSGVVFGIGASGQSPFFIEIEVGEPPPTEIPPLSNGKVDVDQTYSIDFDTGSITSGLDADLWFHVVSPVEKYLEPKNGAQFKHLTTVPSLEKCQTEVLSASAIPFGGVSVGDWLCYRTNEGNVGRTEVEGITPGEPQTIKFDYITWDT